MDDQAAAPEPGTSGGLPGEVALEGAHGDMTWQVRVHGDDAELSSMLYLYRGTKMLDGGGMGGPPLYPGELVNESRGYSDQSPWQIMVRTHPDVTSVVATTERGARLDVPLSQVIQPWGLRFGVAILDDGDAPGGLSVQAADGARDELATPTPPAPPPRSNDGWFPL